MSNQLTNGERNAYEHTISRLSKSNSLSKILLLLIVILLALNAGLYYNNTIQQKNRARAAAKRNQAIITQIQTTNKQEEDLITTKLDTANRHIDCVVAFFTQPERTGLSIADINSCTLNKQGEALQPITNPLSESLHLPTASTPSSTSQPATSQTSNPQTGSSGGSTSGSSGGDSGTTTTTPAIPNCTLDILFIHVGCKQ